MRRSASKKKSGQSITTSTTDLFRSGFSISLIPFSPILDRNPSRVYVIMLKVDFLVWILQVSLRFSPFNSKLDQNLNSL